MLSAIFIGGFASLATELIVMRQLSSFVGSTAVTASIIIGVIMLFMSLGYYCGSTVSLSGLNLRRRIYRSFTCLAAVIILSSSFILLSGYFYLFEKLGIDGIILRTSIYCLIFLSLPSFIFGYITSLLSRYLHKYNRNYTGKIMAVDTIGSVSGSIISTLVLMPLIGVNYTIVVVVFLCLFGAALFIKRIFLFYWLILLFLCGFMLNRSALLAQFFNIVENNAVSTIAITEADDGKSKVMILNDTIASKISTDETLLFPYIRYIEENFLNTLPKGKKHKILVLGAGGFTLGRNDDVNDYVYVDIDASLQKYAEKEFLKKPLGSNKQVIINDANQFLNENKELYDLVILDIYSSITPPPTLVTREYFQRVRQHVRPGGIMAANIIASPDFSDKFSMNIDNTLRHVFSENLQRQVMGKIMPWDGNSSVSNIVYVWYNKENPGKIYTINKNTISLDRRL